MSIFSKPKRHEGKVGGLFYFVSLLSLIILSSLVSIFLLIQFFSDSLPRQSTLSFHLLFVFVGLLIGLVLEGKISVFIHELKHSIVSSLAGNRAKGMKIEEDSGHFEYSFSKQTSHLNAFISLAPYSFPLFCIVSLPLFALFYSKQPLIACAALSCGLGIDLVQNIRDVSPYQTDFSEVRGGFVCGLVYVICFNLLMISLVTLMVMFGRAGFVEFGTWLFNVALAVTSRPDLLETS